jgi:hypothetical protein
MVAADAAWYRMDDVDQHPVITSLIVLDGEPEYERVRRRVEELVLRNPRFMERVVDRMPRPPRWERDPHFDVRHHLHRLNTPASLREVVSDLTSAPFDPERPLWQMHLVEGRHALVSRIHHCVADGIALVRVMLGMIDEAAGTPSLPPPQVGWTKSKSRAGTAKTLWHTLTLSRDPDTILRGQLGPRKEVAWTRAVDLETLQVRAHASGATLNDLITAAIAGGLRTWSREVGRPIESDVRASVPVFLRGGHDKRAMGNAFGLVYATLPVAAADPEERLRLAKQSMDEIKHTPEPANNSAILGTVGLISQRLEHAVVDLLSTRASVVVTNVPGPPLPVHLAGREIKSVMVWAPVGGTISVSITAFSYRGELRLGVRGDARANPRIEDLARAIDDELTTTYGGRAVESDLL